MSKMAFQRSTSAKNSYRLFYQSYKLESHKDLKHTQLFVDFSKAYNSVPREHLLFKLGKLVLIVSGSIIDAP